MAPRPEMASGTGSGRAYWPALDGVRGVAIGVVIAYHLGYLPGGWLGVDCFFILSGYLITTLLLAERRRTGGTALRSFWIRRARRLLPAVLLLLLFLSVYAWVGGPGLVGAQLRTPLLATLLYGANWQQVVGGHGYFAQFLAPSPLAHTCSLAIEEQYYLVWPLLLIALVFLAGRSRRVLVGAIGLLAAASAAWMGVAAHVYGANRAYLGTDTRAWELLIGAMAAVIWTAGGQSRHSRRWSAATVGAVAVSALAVADAGGPPAWIWSGGLVVIAAAMVVVIIGSLRAPTGFVARVLCLRPLVWLGVISYSLYLWHWPAIVLITGTTTGLSGPSLLIVRLVAMTGAACVSFFLVERPLRRADWTPWPRLALVPAALAVTAAMAVVATIPPTAALAAPVSPARPAAPPVASTPTRAEPPTAVVASRAPTADDPLRVWILGDSVMDNASLGVAAALQATHEVKVVENSAFGGWGLATDHGWPADARQVVATVHPEVVIGSWSWDDDLAFDDPGAYTEQLRSTIRLLLSPPMGVHVVVLLQFPQIGPATQITDPARRASVWLASVRHQAAWNRAAQAAAGSFPGQAFYLPTDGIFAPGGNFMTWHQTSTGAWIRARKLDNTHLCPYGAAELGALVEGDLATALRLGPMSPGWESGPWVHDGRYNDPVGTCPADQPPTQYRGVTVPT